MTFQPSLQSRSLTQTGRVLRLAGLFASMWVLGGLGLQAQSTLQITNPAEGTVFNPGQTVVVNVVATGEPFKSVGIVAPGFVHGSSVLTTPPYQFSFTVPPLPTRGLKPGNNQITAVGFTASAGPIYAAVHIALERPDTPKSVTADFDRLDLPAGRSEQINVDAIYSDGTGMTVTESSLTTFVSQNPAVATVSPWGDVTGAVPGSTNIVIRHLNKRIVVPIRVYLPRE
jgi:hypothetical protein